MFFKRRWLHLNKFFTCLMLFAGNFVASTALAQGNVALEPSTILDVKPNKCVALNEGRSCFASVNISWRLKAEQSYCLVAVNSVDEADELGCWRQSKVGNINLDLELTRSVDLKLVTLDGKKVLASSVFQVSWLYESSPRKRRWRLF
ncbi:hypothetical protein GCM10007852_19000 [Agaribacter marinus]|uniref:DUF3019 domain-containing protein n=1 Tax=Agaribacter marinus TaxID=1431249 RepID=A0AA37SWR8_9ALTE|nr:hypothetical protein GCM10007852_19000 [Agaribacter marinus]